MNLAQPVWLAAMAIVPVLFLLAAVSLRRRQRAYAQVFRPEMLARILPPGLARRRWTSLVLTSLGLCLVALSLAEPRYGKEVREVEREGVDLVVAVDLSRSMNAQDVEPSRLGRAQRELYDLIEMLEGDRVGLVIYAGGAYGRMPLTLDYDAFELLIRELDTTTFTAQGSSLGAAIREGMRLLGDDQGTGRAILVLSDGEVHDPSDAMAAAAEAKAASVRVYALGIGDEAAPIPLGDGRALTWKGETVMTTPTSDVLRDVAKLTGGAYVQSVASTDDMQRLYQNEIRRSLEAQVTGTMQKESWRTAYQLPLAMGMLSIVFGLLGGENRRTALIVAALLVAVPARASSVTDGDAAYRSGKYAEAAELFTELAMRQPGNAELWERLGAARYRAKDFEGAARAYDRAAELSGDVDAIYSAGNAHYQAGRLDEAVERYDRVLAEDPTHPGAARNLAILVRELEARQQKDPPPPPPQPKPQPQEEQGSGEQQEGEQGEQGEQGEGEQGEQQPQPGEGQDGSTEDQGSEGNSEQSTGSGEPSEPTEGGGAQESDGTDRTGDQAREPGEEGEGEGEGQPESLEALEGEGEGGEEATAVGQGGSDGAGEAGAMTEAQAERLLEGVEEGRPRVTIPGGRSERPW